MALIKHFPSSRLAENILRMAGVLLAVWILLPSFMAKALQLGLDPSWEVSINLARGEGREFGVDYVFPYGPLGFLSTRIAVGIPMVVFIAYDFFRAAIGAYAVWYAVRHKRAWHILVPLGLLLLVPEIHMFAMMLFLLLHTLRHRSSWTLLAAASVSVLAFYMKLNLGVAAGMAFVASLAAGALLGVLSPRRAGAGILLWLAMLWTMALLLNVNLSAYTWSGLQLIGGYNDAMVWPIYGADGALIAAVTVLASVAVLTILNTRIIAADPVTRIGYSLMCLLLFVLFKSAFVRPHIGHELAFLLGAPLLPASLFLFTHGTLRRQLAVVSWMCLCVCLLAVGWNQSKAVVRANLLPLEYVRDLRSGLESKRTYADALRTQRYLPPDILSRLRGGTVDIIPREITYAAVHGLAYNPRPICQSYQAYNGFLDRLNSMHFESPSAPNFILYQHGSIDGRHPFWDEPITKRSIFKRYRVADWTFDEAYYLNRYPDVAEAVREGKISSGQEHYQVSGRSEGRSPAAIILERRVHPLHCKLGAPRRVRMILDRPCFIDRSERPQYLFAEVEYSLLGQIKALLFQAPVIVADLACEDGTLQQFRAIKPILETGVLLNKRVLNNEEATALFNSLGQDNVDVVAIRFSSPEPWAFRPRIRALIRELETK